MSKHENQFFKICDNIGSFVVGIGLSCVYIILLVVLFVPAMIMNLFDKIKRKGGNCND